jgi:hypothetical protein
MHLHTHDHTMSTNKLFIVSLLLTTKIGQSQKSALTSQTDLANWSEIENISYCQFCFSIV